MLPLATDPTADAAELMRVLERTLAALDAVDIAGVTPAVLGELAHKALRARRQIDALSGRMAGQFALSGEWRADGARSAHAWLAGTGNESRGAVRQILDQAEVAARFPLLGSAWAHGEVASRHLGIVGKMFDRYHRLRHHLIANDDAITGLALACEPRRFEQELNGLCYSLDPESVDAAEEARQRDTFLHVSRLDDGTVKVDAHLDAVLGQQFMLALDAMMQRVRREEPPVDPESDPFSQVGEPVASDAAPLPDSGPMTDPRARSRQRLDAFARLIELAVSVTGPDGLPTISGVRPVVNVQITVDSLIADDQARSRTMAWLEHLGLPSVAISPRLVRRMACDAAIQPLIVDRHGNLVALLPRSRAIAPMLRRAIIMRDQHCRFPGCRSRIDEVHHITFFRNGGRTVKSNLVGLCRYHHHAAHEGGWHIEGDPGGELIFRAPEGLRYASSLPPPRGAP